MKLTYRGLEYERNFPGVEMVESPLVGCYRGVAYPYRYPRHLPVPQPALHLTYRGVGYGSDGMSPLHPVGATPELKPAIAPSASFQARQTLKQRIAQVHQDSIRRSTERRLAAAQARGDQSLVQMLETELRMG